MRILKRREFLTAGAAALGGTFVTPRLAFARTSADSRARVVFVILRGALDGLAVVPPYRDPDYASLRRELTLGSPGSAGGALPLDGSFGLHPSLAFLHESYAANELIVFHAIASPYRERSHFDGQDVLESGALRAHAVQTGWLNRALASLQSKRGSSSELGVALGQNVPLMIRGPAAVTSWSPSKLAALDEDTLQRISDLYAGDPILATRLADALAADSIAGAAQNMPGAGSGSSMPEATQSTVVQPEATASLLQRARPTRYTEIVRAAAGFLKRDDGPQVAVFDTTGWDTHANEGNASGQLATRLAALDDGLRTLKVELGPVWNDTVVILATEFGRTAATNGTRGTDHGTAGAAFMVGGAVQGGCVIADWPGLSRRSLYEERDLKPTSDLRSVFKGVLADHMRVSSATLDSQVFPDSSAARPLQGMIRS